VQLLGTEEPVSSSTADSARFWRVERGLGGPAGGAIALLTASPGAPLWCPSGKTLPDEALLATVTISD
jgi:hypothetical protein